MGRRKDTVLKHDLTFLKPLVATILRDRNREWTVQGFGFLRTYFGSPEQPKKYRLNLWDSRLTVPNVSTIHDHPWDFKSVIIAGHFENQRYQMQNDGNKTHNYAILKTGIGGMLSNDIKTCSLYPDIPEIYLPGDTYSQKANEIHETKFLDGSVTINERIGDTEHARVFWNYPSNWVDAIPRTATLHERDVIISHSLEKWF